MNPTENTADAQATTEYGTWPNHIRSGGTTNLHDDVVQSLGDAVEDYDVDALCVAYTEAIREALAPHGVSFHNGEDFYGPWGTRDEVLGSDLIGETIAGIDFFALAAEHDTTTEDTMDESTPVEDNQFEFTAVDDGKSCSFCHAAKADAPAVHGPRCPVHHS